MPLDVFVARTLKHVPWLHRPAKALYWRLFPTTEMLLDRVLGAPETLSFVQVGSNDAGYGDPLFDRVAAHDGWRGLLVEPVPSVHERLRRRYGELPDAAARFRFEQAAVTTEDGTRTFHHVDPAAADDPDLDLPVWWDQLSGFDRGHIVRMLPQVEPYVRAQPLPCVSFASLCAKHGIEGFDLLHIDTEGHDWSILRQVDLARHRPQVVVFEHKHLAAGEEAAALRHLRRHGYRCRRLRNDVVAWR